MSDAPQGPGWWQASDGRFYPPEQSPAPGWWQASDGRFYPPQATATPPAHAGTRLTGTGVTGRVTVDDTFVTINRKGARAKLTHGFTQGEKRIPIASIVAVQYKEPKLTNGYIQFTFAGGNEGTRGVLQAAKDENTVVFALGHAHEFSAIRNHIERRIMERHRPEQAPHQAPASRSVSEELQALANLRDQGILTADEFEQQKARLLQ